MPIHETTIAAQNFVPQQTHSVIHLKHRTKHHLHPTRDITKQKQQEKPLSQQQTHEKHMHNDIDNALSSQCQHVMNCQLPKDKK